MWKGQIEELLVMGSTQSVFNKIKWQFNSGEVQQMSNGGHLPG